MSVRQPAVAGLFYPDQARRLESAVADLLGKAPSPSGAAPKAVIAPHSGYVYSGPTAAAAFAPLRAGAGIINRVVLIGPAHYVRLEGLAIPSSAAFSTPLGEVPIDREALGRLADLPYAAVSDAPHAPEHALEVELPFLQTVLGDFAVAPLLTGTATLRQVATVLDRL